MTTLVETFPGTVGMGISNPSGSVALEIAGTLKATQLTVGGVSNSFFPTGSIAIWTSLTAPTGWALCNGQNGTPDLRNYFIIGAGGSGYKSPGTTGGSNNVTLTAGMLPTHSHTFTVDTNGSHTHTYNVQQASSHNHTVTVSSGGGHTHNANTGAGGAHNHPSSTGNASHNHSTVSTNTHNHNHGHRSGRDCGVRCPSAYGHNSRAFDHTCGEVNQSGYGSQPWYGGGAHAHGVWTSNSGHHTHGVVTGQGDSHNHAVGNGSANYHSHTASIGQTGSHLHPISMQNAADHSHQSGTTQTTGSSNQLDIRPPYRVVAFIIKL